MDYLVIKYLHILSATLLLGTGLGSAFYKWRADKSGDLASIAFTNKNVVLADWLFTTPTVVLQPLTGLLLAYRQGYFFSAPCVLQPCLLPPFLFPPWLWLSIALFFIAGVCWLLVVYLQLKMRDTSIDALNTQSELPLTYKDQAKIWFWLGIPAFSSILLVYALMIVKPAFLYQLR